MDGMRQRHSVSVVFGIRYFSGGGGGSFLEKDDVTGRVLDVVKNFPKVSPDAVKESSNFITDLGLDSLDEVEMIMHVEEEFCIEISDNESEKIHSVQDAIEYVLTHPNAK